MAFKYIAKIPTGVMQRPFRYTYRAPAGWTSRRGSLTTRYEQTAGSTSGVPASVSRTTKVEVKGGSKSGSVRFDRTVYVGTSKMPYEGRMAGGTRPGFKTKSHTNVTRSSRGRLSRVLRGFSPSIPNSVDGRALRRRYGSSIRG